ncbi:MAG: hypothetical protein HQL84_04085 [Magnetococcales bacterium]|nr:hypothetical protein [Magnetococcales bacterium]
MAEMTDTTTSSDQQTLDSTISDVAAATTGAMGDTRGLNVGEAAPSDTQTTIPIDPVDQTATASTGTVAATAETETTAAMSSVDISGVGVLSGFDPTFGLGTEEIPPDAEVAPEPTATDRVATDTTATTDISGVGVLSGFDPTFGLGTGEVVPEDAAATVTETTAEAQATTQTDISGVGVLSGFDPTFGLGTGEVVPEDAAATEPATVTTAEAAATTATDISGVGVLSGFDPTFGAGSDPGAETPSLDLANGSGVEDQAIPLSIAASLNDLDGSESLQVRIEGVPEGALLSAGQNMGNGIWVLSADDLVGLTVTPAPDSDADFQLSVTATATESSDGSQSSISGIMNVVVDADADLPVLVLNDVAGVEDTAIPLNITAHLADVDGSESLSITILEGVPQGAILSAGTDNGDGTWSLSTEDLVGLTITPPADSGDDFTLTVRAVSYDGDDSAAVVGTIHVDVSPDADVPVLVLNNAAGMEDSAIPLEVRIALNDQDGSESIQGRIIITDVPEGAVLSLGAAGPDHTWTIPTEHLAVLETNPNGDPVAWHIPGLTVTPPENAGDDFSLGIRVTVQDGSDLATMESRLDVAVTPVADAADLALTRAAGDEDTTIPLDLSFALQDQDGSERLSGNVVLTDIPEGAALNVGEAGPGHTWVIPQDALVVTAHNAAGDPVAWEVPNLTLTPPRNSDADFSIGVRLVTMEGDQARVTDGQMEIVVHPLADAVTFSVPEPVLAAENDDLSRSGRRGGSRSGDGDDRGGRRDDSRHGRDDDSRHGRDDDSRHGRDDDSRRGGGRNDDSRHGGGRDDDSRHGGSNHGGSHDGDEHVVPLGLQINLHDTDGSESLAGGIVVTGVPEGAVLTLGVPGADGQSWIIGAEHLMPVAFNDAGDAISWSVPNLGIIPPEDAEPGFVLGVQVTTRDGDNLHLTEGALTVDWEEHAGRGGSRHGSRSGGRYGADGREVEGTGDDVLAIHVAKGGFGNGGAFDLVVDGETVGRFTAEMANDHGRDHGHGHDRWDTITIDNLNLASDQAHEIRIEPVHANSHILVDSIEVNGVALEAETAGQLTRGAVHDDFVKISNGGELVFSLPAMVEEADSSADAGVDRNVTGNDGDEVIVTGAGDDIIAGMGGDDVIGGGAGDDVMDGGDGNDLFIIGNDQGHDQVNGGEGEGWVDAIHLENVSGGPLSASNPDGNWTLETAANFTIDEVNQQIRFEGANASGTITLEDGTLIEFDNMEMIGW